jgi:hypothetical protein
MIRVMNVAVATLLLAACAGEAKDGAKDAARATVAAQDPATATGTRADTRDACELITTAELATVFAPRTFAVDTSGPVPRNRVGKANQNSTTSCTFSSAHTSVRDLVTVTVMVVTSPSDAAQRTVDQMKKGVMSLGLNAKPVDVTGLGDGAYWVNLGSTRRSAFALNVKNGARRWLTVGESSSGERDEDTVARLTKLAELALAKL